MAVPYTKYVEVKDNYCLAYFGNEQDLIKTMLEARNVIEKELKGLKVFIACNDRMKHIVHGKRNIILESSLNNFSGKMACFRNLEKKEDLKSLLDESKITFDV
jgi:hypothetical protein